MMIVVIVVLIITHGNLPIVMTHHQLKGFRFQMEKFGIILQTRVQRFLLTVFVMNIQQILKSEQEQLHKISQSQS
jgi:hypothetical protein